MPPTHTYMHNHQKQGPAVAANSFEEHKAQTHWNNVPQVTPGERQYCDTTEDLTVLAPRTHTFDVIGR